jgi:hypothetical protein
MEETILIALISALGVKEIWNIIKKKIDINAKKQERENNIYIDQIDLLTNKVEQLEVKIDELIKENLHLKVKIVKMESRILLTAKNRIKK